MIYKELSLLKISSGHCESNTGHFELQSNALPSELCPVTEQNNFTGSNAVFLGTIPRFHVLRRESNPHPVINIDNIFAVNFHIYAPVGA